MSRTLEQYHRDVIGGERGVSASLLRGSLRAVEPFYALVTRARNAMFDRGLRFAVRVGRPVVSVGNITTGGTGKTPVVRWLVERLRHVGQHPAILLRGYRGGDEQRMLQSQLPETVIEANPSRVEGARRVLDLHPEVSVFVLDDGFQHRQIHRDLDLVLIDAANPFGFDHVLPRGLLREPLGGLARANAFLITHCEAVEHAKLGEIESTLRRFNPNAPIFKSEHAQIGFEGPDVTNRKVFAFCGIGNPAAFDRQLDASGFTRVGSHWFGDHHAYTVGDLTMLRDKARQSGAGLLVTTEKDWVKLSGLVATLPDLPPIARAKLAIKFLGDDETGLYDRIIQTISSQPLASSLRSPSRESSAPVDGAG
jgi:tetraacyldisaccharide 4'-kinase